MLPGGKNLESIIQNNNLFVNILFLKNYSIS